MNIIYLSDLDPQCVARRARRQFERGEDISANPYELSSPDATRWMLAYIGLEMEAAVECAEGACLV